MIEYCQIPIPACEQINHESGKRFYRTPGGSLYPSVTTVLSSIPNPAIVEWKKKVGEKKAKEISEAATRRGSLLHEWCETHIKGGSVKPTITQHITYAMFKSILPEINKLTKVYALETRLWSDRLKIAGSVDCIGEIDGVITVIDFKTSGRYKSAEDIPDYFMQCSAYAMCWYELTGMKIGNIKIIMATEDDGALVFDERVTDWLPKFIEVRKNYEKLHSI